MHSKGVRDKEILQSSTQSLTVQLREAVVATTCTMQFHDHFIEQRQFSSNGVVSREKSDRHQAQLTLLKLTNDKLDLN